VACHALWNLTNKSICIRAHRFFALSLFLFLPCSMYNCPCFCLVIRAFSTLHVLLTSIFYSFVTHLCYAYLYILKFSTCRPTVLSMCRIHSYDLGTLFCLIHLCLSPAPAIVVCPSRLLLYFAGDTSHRRST